MSEYWKFRISGFQYESMSGIQQLEIDVMILPFSFVSTIKGLP